MNLDDFKLLLNESESQHLDWKRDWPNELVKGKNDVNWEDGRGKLLKDLISLANSDRSGMAYLVFGVKDLKVSREINGISKSFDDAIFQEWTKNIFDPPPRFLYNDIKWEESSVLSQK